MSFLLFQCGHFTQKQSVGQSLKQRETFRYPNTFYIHTPPPPPFFFLLNSLQVLISPHLFIQSIYLTLQFVEISEPK
jgi:hypothetical protein